MYFRLSLRDIDLILNALEHTYDPDDNEHDYFDSSDLYDRLLEFKNVIK